MQNFFYTYIMIFALYMVILLYGQIVSTNVATEKSSRAMPFSKQSFIKPDQSLYEAKQGEFHADLRGIPLVYQNDA